MPAALRLIGKLKKITEKLLFCTTTI